MKDKIVLVDICGTLFRSNTTFDFLHWLLRGDERYLKFERTRKWRIIGFLNHYIFLILGIDMIRNVALRFLKGYTHKQLLYEADRFCYNYLDKRKNEQVFCLLEKLKSQGKKLVLVSATIDCVAHAVSAYCGISPFFSTELGYENNICTGCIKKDLLANKYLNIYNVLGCSHFDCVITDNYSDLDIINKADCAILIQYSKSKNKWLRLIDKINSKWQILEI